MKLAIFNVVGWAATAVPALEVPLVGDIYQVEGFLVPKRVMNFLCGLCCQSSQYRQ